jgi:hypothetical protein
MWLAEKVMKFSVIRLSGRSRLGGWIARAGIAIGMAALRIPGLFLAQRVSRRL